MWKASPGGAIPLTDLLVDLDQFDVEDEIAVNRSLSFVGE